MRPAARQERLFFWGIDYSSTAIRLATENLRDTRLPIEFSVGDCLNLAAFDERTFDLAIDNHVLHCLTTVEHRRMFLRAAWRVLKVGGILFSETMSAEGEFDWFALEVDPETRTDRRRTRYWVKSQELDDELGGVGFVTVWRQLRPQPDRPAHGDTIVTVSKRLPG